MLSNSLSTSSQVDNKDEFLRSSFDLVLSSPSKVNLFFRVLAKRADGFHEIASLYQALGLYDTLCFRLSEKFHVSCSDPHLSCSESNLVTKAARLFAAKTGIDLSVHIHLVKNIPVEAGLGGGSGDAATTLWGLNELFHRPASESDLRLWGAELGSDVSFFFSSGTAYCTGRGEKLQEIEGARLPSDVTIVKPLDGLSTPLVYKNCRTEEFVKRDPQLSLQSFLNGAGEYYNDLEVPSFTLLPALKEMKAMLISSGFSHVVMCGSGTAFFCLGDGHLPENSPWQVSKTSFIVRNDRQSWYE